MSEETAYWAWLLFASELPTARAKALLEAWQGQGGSLQTALQRLPQEAAALGLTADEAARLRPPARLAPIPALRWNEPLYPTGWQALPLRQRPALLFYRGDAALLSRPRLYIPPAELAEANLEAARETLSLTLGERFTPVTLHGSPQSALLMEELQDSEGELILMGLQGLETYTPAPVEASLLEAGRLLWLTPLPPQAKPNPAWQALLEGLCGALAAHWLLTTTGQHPPIPAGVSAACIAPDEGATLDAGIQRLASPAEIPLWLENLLAAEQTPSPESLPDSEPVLGPPPTPEEALRILQKGGRVPEVLRRRLEER